jgi:dihydroorotase
LKILIKNGTIINEGLSFKGSLFINGEIISEIIPQVGFYDGRDVDIVQYNDKIKSFESEADKVVDAEGLCIAPGIIDDHVHFREPGATHKGSIESESAAAVLGGVTSYMDMPNNIPPACSLLQVEDKFKIASRNSYANYSFYLGANNDNICEIINVDKKRVCGIKVFMGSSTGNMMIYDPIALEQIFAKSPILIATHCEEEKIIKENLEKAKLRFGVDIPFSEHPNIRSREECMESTRKALKLALKYSSRLHILHVSTKEEIDMISEAKAVNLKISGEICVHYLWFNDSDYEKYGSKIKCNPAIKSKEDMIALRNALKRGSISVLGTDHAPHLESEKRTSYLDAPSGLPLVQFSLQMMLELYKKKVFKIEEVVDRMSHSPANCFKIKDRGFIREGYYADIVLFNLNKPSIVVPASRCGWSPFDSFSTSVVHTFVNGTQVVEDSSLTGLKAGMELRFEID